MPRPKRKPGSPERDKIVGVRMSEAELQLLTDAVAREMVGVTGATASLPKFLLAAGLDRARKILATRG